MQIEIDSLAHHFQMAFLPGISATFTSPWLLLTILMLTAMGTASAQGDSWKAKVHPERERAALAPGRTYNLIVMVQGDREPAFETLLKEVSLPVSAKTLDGAWIRVLRGYEVESQGSKLKRLVESPQVRSVWVVAEDLGDRYGAILRGMAYAIENLPPASAANMSLGPLVGREGSVFDLEEPVHQLSRLATEKGIGFVFSAGNEGPDDNTLNPWGLADWTISVGAATPDGKTLWPRSSRGAKGSRRFRPAFVAPGVDMIVAHPEGIPKSADQQAAEERVGFRKRVPKEEWSRKTVASGTSIAASEASRCVSLLLHFLSEEVRIRSEAKAAMVLELGFPKGHTLDRERLIGTLREEKEYLVASYPLNRPDPRLIKQLLMDVALPMPGYAAHEVGAGFVSYEVVFHHFGKHGDPGAGLMPVKVEK
jgi:Subtilase family